MAASAATGYPRSVDGPIEQALTYGTLIAPVYSYPLSFALTRRKDWTLLTIWLLFLSVSTAGWLWEAIEGRARGDDWLLFAASLVALATAVAGRLRGADAPSEVVAGYSHATLPWTTCVLSAIVLPVFALTAMLAVLTRCHAISTGWVSWYPGKLAVQVGFFFCWLSPWYGIPLGLDMARRSLWALFSVWALFLAFGAAFFLSRNARDPQAGLLLLAGLLALSAGALWGRYSGRPAASKPGNG